MSLADRSTHNFLDFFKAMFFGRLYHGRSPFFSTIWQEYVCHVFQPPNHDPRNQSGHMIFLCGRNFFQTSTFLSKLQGFLGPSRPNCRGEPLNGSRNRESYRIWGRKIQVKDIIHDEFNEMYKGRYDMI